ncbi:MAG: hypothetical protein EAZ17_06375 [Sphingobacteriales bacterium]|nr:MAG: hypothetical protein EAZ17_06375 [Sphingobacteriales bacterium]
MNKSFFMKNQLSLAVLLIVLSLTLSLQGIAQDGNPITQPKLREMIVQLGYTVKDIDTAKGKEKFEIKTTKDGLDVPILYQISSSGSYMWLTVSLGNAPAIESILNASLLKQNAKIQPCQFYTTESGKLMMGLAVDNRGINNAQLRRYTEFITGKVVETKAFWMR